MDENQQLPGGGVMKFSTRAIHVGEEADFKGSGDVVIPIHLSTTFARRDPEVPTAGYEYTRTGNPTRNALEEKLAAIEYAKHAIAFSSGLAAESTFLLSLLKSGDEIIVSDDLYGGTRRIFDSVMGNFAIRYGTFNLATPIDRRIFKGKKMVWIETPSNPLMKIIDIKEIAEYAHENGSILVVDNTFASPYFQNPLKMGADAVIHSTTKYINGHSDSLGGAVVLDNEEMYERVKFNQNAVGAVLSPFDSFLTLRGIKTLAVRMEKHQANAMEIARYLENRSEVEKVFYPGLESFQYHETAKRQMRGFGGMLSFRVRRNATAFLKNLKYFSLAESLGGVESLVELPFFMTHASIPEKERRKLGITENLVRMSVGIEDVSDLIEDIENAFLG